MGASPDIVGTAGVDVVPVLTTFNDRLKAAVLPIADKVGLDAGRTMGDRMGEAMRASLAGVGQQVGAGLGQTIADALARQVVGALPDAVTAGGRRATVSGARAGDDTGGAFARSMKAKLEAAFKSMPKLNVGLADTGVDAQLARIRAELEQLSRKRIGVDIDAETADAKVADLEARLTALGASHPNPVVRADTAVAIAALEQVRAEIESITRAPWEIDVTPGSFRERLVAQVEAAQAALPQIMIDADTDPAEAQLARLRAELVAIPQRLTTDADFDDTAALARIDALRVQLTELSRSSARIDVRVDAAAAEAELATVAAMVDGVNQKRARINVDTEDAAGAVMSLGMQVAALAAIPGAAVLAAGIGSIAAVAVAAAAGVGAIALAAAPAISGVMGAIQAQTAAQQEATSATTAGSAASTTAQQHALSLAGAEQSLASAKRSAAQQTTSANEQVRQSEQAVADAVAQAATDQAQAARKVLDAEQSLADAQRSELQAQQDLTAARKTAEQQLASLSDQLADGALSERDAALQVQQAEQDLQATLANPTSSQLQRAQAQLTADQALQHQKEQHESYLQQQQDAAAAQAAGVNGAQVVTQAQDRLHQAQESTASQAQALADAQANVAKVATASARSIADAQQKVADAERNAADARASAADSIASAQRGLQQAMLSTASSTAGAGSATDKYNAALAKLSPQARALFDAIAGPNGLKSAFTSWGNSLQGQTLPLFVRAVDGAKAAIPALTPLVLAAADAIGKLMDKASAQLKSPFWQGFKRDIDTSAGPAILGLGVTIGNVIQGAAGIIDAFLPHVDSIAAHLAGITGKFANWGANLKGSPAFEAFLAYVGRVGPGLASTVGKIGTAFLDVSQALAPLSGPVIKAVGDLAQGLSAVATHAPGVVLGIYGIMVASNLAKLAMVGFAAAVGLYEIAVAAATLVTDGWDAAVEATGIVPVIQAIVIAVALLVVGVIYAYNHWSWFRIAVVATWDAIKIAALFVWNYVLKPAFEGIWTAMQFVGTVAVWLWKNAIGPAFQGIWEAAKILFAIVAVAVIAPLIIAFNLLSAAGMWLWTNAIDPAFQYIAAAAEWLWKKVLQPYIAAWILIFQDLGAIGLWLWDHALSPALSAIGNAFVQLWDKYIKPAFDAIESGAAWLYDNALKPAFDKISDALKPLGAAFGVAKDLIATAWNQLYDITKKPINFLIQSVYTDGIKAVWDEVADFVSLPHLPNAPKLLAAGGTVGSGWGPAVPMVTNRPTAIVGEGNPAYPEYVIPTDPKFRSRALALHAAAGTQLLASGGILGDIWSGITDASGAAWNFAKDGADLFAHPGQIWDRFAKPITNLFSQIGTSPMAKDVIGIPTHVLSGLKDKLVSFVGLGSQGTATAGGVGVEKWIPTILQALGLLGQSPGYLGVVERRMNQESGGNPGIVNTTDSNWAAGTPSVGLMQVIGPTFQRYADAFATKGPFLYGTSTDPLANTYAGLNYALHRYGSLDALNRPGGYDSGGYLPTGTSLVYNHTGKPEPVFTTGQWDAIQRAGVGGGGTPEFDVHVYVGDREITDIVRTEVHTATGAMAQQLMAGVN